MKGATTNGAAKAHTPSPRERFFSGVTCTRLKDFAMCGADEYLEARSERVEYVLDGIVQPEHLVLVAGPSGEGKTTYITLLIAALANPGAAVEVLGRRVRPVPDGQFVLLVEEENSRTSIARKLVAACEVLGLPVRETLDRVVTLPRAGFDLHDQAEGGACHALYKRASEGLIGATFFDSWATVARNGDSNKEEAQAEIAGWFRTMISASGGPCFVILHTRKQGATSIEDVAGSHQRAAAADVVLLVTAEKEDGRVLNSKIVVAKLRDSDGDEHPAPVTYALATNGGKLSIALGPTAREEDQPLHERVHRLLCERGEMLRADVRKELKCNGPRLDAAIEVLKAERRAKFTKRRDGKWALRADDKPEVLKTIFKSAHAPPPSATEGADDAVF